jgi:hypothetical protein
MSNKTFSAERYPLVPVNLLRHDKGFWEPELYCDLHGVVLKWKEKFLKFASETLQRPINPDDVTFYYPQFQAGLGISPAEFDELFAQFAGLGEGGYGDLDAYDGIVDALKQIHEAGIRIKVATWTPGASEISFAHSKAFGSGAAQGTTKRLIERLGIPTDVRELEFMSPGAKHFKMQEDHVPLILEDCPFTASAVAAAGLGCILLPERYNEDIWIPGVTRLDNRSDLASTVIRFFTTLREAGVISES